MRPPDWRSELRQRLAGLLLAPDREIEIVDELAAHLEECCRDRAASVGEEEARRQVLAELGPADELVARFRGLRQVGRGAALLPSVAADRRRWYHGLGRDVRYAWRGLIKRPVFTASVVGTLALGLGASLSIFGVVDAVLLRAVPFEAMDRLVLVWQTDRDSGTTREPASFPDFLDVQSMSRTLGESAALMGTEVTAAIGGGAPQRLAGLAVTHELLPMLGVEPLIGRSFTAEEDRPGGRRVAVISEGLWTRLLDRDPGVLDRQIRIDDEAVPIIGVVPQGADLGVRQILSAAAYARAFADRGDAARVDIWLPRQWDASSMPRATHPIFVLGRLRDDASVTTAQSELARIHGELERAYPENAARGAFVEPLTEVVFGPVRPALLVLLGAVGLVLVVSCANAATLLLARGARRLPEVAVRRALGAETVDLVRQGLVEGGVLTAAALLVGLGVAHGALELLRRLAPAGIPRVSEVALDGRVLMVALGVSVVVAMISGLLPLGQMRRAALATGGPGRGGGHDATPAGRVTASALVVAQVALAVVLIAGTGLLVRSFWNVLGTDPGFASGGVLKAEYQLSSRRYPVDMARFPNFEEAHGLNASLREQVSAIPGVTEAAVAGNHPLDAGFTNSFVVIGRESEASDWPEISVRRVTPGYLETVSLALRSGRPFQPRDDAQAPRVALVNQAAATRFFEGRDPIGRELGFWGARWRIVGVVEDERFHGVEAAPPLAAYLPLAQAPSLDGTYTLLAHTAGDPAALAPAIRRIAQELDPGLALFAVEPLDRTLSRSVGERRFLLSLLAVFAALTALLAAGAVHGILSHAVARRRHEIGIRLALGAPPGRVARAVAGEGVRLTLVGLAAGWLAAAAGARVMSSLLYETAPFDPLTFGLVPVVALALAVTASLSPALRAARVDPLTTLRAE